MPGAAVYTLAGVVLGALIPTLKEVFVDRQARADRLRVSRAEFQREALLALMDAVERMSTLAISPWPEEEEARARWETALEYRAAYLHTLKLTERLADADVRDAVRLFASVSNKVFFNGKTIETTEQAEAAGSELGEASAPCLKALGRALRHLDAE